LVCYDTDSLVGQYKYMHYYICS